MSGSRERGGSQRVVLSSRKRRVNETEVSDVSGCRSAATGGSGRPVAGRPVAGRRKRRAVRKQRGSGFNRFLIVASMICGIAAITVLLLYEYGREQAPCSSGVSSVQHGEGASLLESDTRVASKVYPSGQAALAGGMHEVVQELSMPPGTDGRPPLVATPEATIDDDAMWPADPVEGIPEKDGIIAVGINPVWRLKGAWDLFNPQCPGYLTRDHYPDDLLVGIATDTPEVLRLDGGTLSDLPLIEAGQTVHITVPGLGLGNYVLCVALVEGEFMAKRRGDWNVEVPQGTPANCPALKGDFLRFRFNDRLVFARWRHPVRTLMKAFIPSDAVDAELNTLTIENFTCWPLAVDAVWLERPTVAERVTITVDGAEWLTNPEVTADIGSVYKSLPPLLVDAPNWGNAGRPERIGSLAARRHLWQAVMGAAAEKGADDWAWTPQKTENFIRQALWLDMEPVLHLAYAQRVPVDAILSMLERYGPFVRHWIMPVDADGGLGQLPEEFKRLVPGGELLPDHGYTATDVPFCKHIDAWQSDLEMYLTQFRHAAMKHGRTQWGLGKTWYRNASFYTAYSWQRQRQDIDSGVANIMNWLGSGGSGLVLGGGGTSDSLFHGDDYRVGTAWEVIRLITCIAEDDPKRISSNLVPANQQYGLTEAQWIAVQHAGERASFLGYAGDDTGRTVTITLPVTWRTPNTRLAIRSAKISDTFEFPPTQTRSVKTKIVEGVPGGVVQFDLTMPTLFCVRLWADNSAPSQREIKPLSPPRNVSGQFKPGVFRVVEKSETSGLWAYNMKPSPFLLNSLSSEDQVRLVPATPGQVGKVANVVPVASKSMELELAPVAAPWKRRTGGMLIFVHGIEREHLRAVGFWVRPRSEDGAERIPLLLRSFDDAWVVSLKANQWNHVVAPTAELNLYGSACRYRLAICADPAFSIFRGPGKVVYEFNGAQLAGLGEEITDSVSTKIHFREITGRGNVAQNEKKFLVMAAPGKMAYHEERFSRPLLLDEWTADWGQVACEYIPEAQLLRVAIKKMPGTTDCDMGYWQRRLTPVEFDMYQSGTAVPVELTLRQKEAVAHGL